LSWRLIAARGILEAGGLPEEEVAAWRAAAPVLTGAFEPDTAAAVEYLSLGEALLDRLPERPRRREREQAAAEAVAADLSVERERFLGAHVERVYAALTDDFATPLRDEQLVYAAAERFPGLTPTQAEVTAELDRKLADKEGVEIAQGDFLGHVLSSPPAGNNVTPQFPASALSTLIARSVWKELMKFEVRQPLCASACGPASPNSRAMRRMVSASMPVIPAAHSGVYPPTLLASSSKPSVYWLTKAPL